MTHILDLFFSPANAIATTFLLIVVIYWITVIIGLLDTDFLDLDIDVDTEADFEGELDSGTSSDVSWLNKVLVFFNLGKIPFMVWLTFLTLPLWLATVYVNGFLGIQNFFLGLIVFFPVFIGSLFVAKILTWPFVKFFAKLDEDTQEKSILGRVGTVKLPATHTSKGQAEINYNGTFLDFYILAKREGVSIPKGSKVEFIKKSDDSDTYWVEPYIEI